MSSWDPARYLRFGDQRTRPAAELLSRVPVDAPAAVVDLGCGPGNSTRLLADRWPQAELLGVDSSEAMVARARADHRSLQFATGDVTTWAPEAQVDVVFANAVLQWVPDHLALLPRLFSWVAQGGTLALQVPNNFDRPAHTEGHRIVGASFADLVGVLPDRPVFDPADHYDALAGPDVTVDIWQTEYLHPLTGLDPVVAWTSGTYLRPLLDALDDDPTRRAAFLSEYAGAMRRAYPPRPDGVTLLPFPRLFVVATRR